MEQENYSSLAKWQREELLQDLDHLLEKALNSKVSDIHLLHGLTPMFRINGELLPAEAMEILENEDIALCAQAITNKTQWTKFLKEGEADLAYSMNSGRSRFRVNIFRQRGYVSIVFRQIPYKIPTLESLGMPLVLRNLVQKPQGLFLVTGPTGSGKSTTLAAMLDYLNETARKHVLTLEDPIEYVYEHKQSIISQREIGRDTSSFANGLRAGLRQDPDIILVGEMRDFDTISIALTAAETGHLVLGTLHTSSAASTIDRIVDVFPAEQRAQITTQLAGSLVGILSQRLLPTREGNGRVAATELMVNTKSIANLIRSGKNHQIVNMMQTGKQTGMHTMDASLSRLIATNQVDADVADSLLTEGR